MERPSTPEHPADSCTTPPNNNEQPNAKVAFEKASPRAPSAGVNQSQTSDHLDLQREPTPRPATHNPEGRADTPETPGQLPPYDWDDFQTRYEAALLDVDEEEELILKDAEILSSYFRSWASASSAHDDERAVKRLQTRQRFVNLSEEKVAQKQKHYEEVVRAFESALALLKSR